MINKIKNKIYLNWNDLYKHSNVFDLPWVSDEIHPVLKKAIDDLYITKGYALDVGCGLGQVSRYLASCGFETTAIDISEEAIRLSEIFNNTNKRINYKTANSLTFLSDQKFDLIVDFLHIHDIGKMKLINI